ncbi:Low-density lipoprotein receptor- protein 1B [Homalodisca vitripennis]|nr:Low-density lipoprotein receptor- protein 1B [Homalodisca vitripennis]
MSSSILDIPRWANDNFCYCGSDIAEGSIKRDDNLCDVPCSDTDPRTCGGDWLMSLYEIKREPSGVVEDSVKFLIGITVGVRLYDTVNLSNYDTIASTGDWVHALDYHFAKKTVYIFSRNKLYKTTMEPKNSAPELVRVLSMCEGFAVDWLHDKIYWMNCSGNSTAFMSMDLGGGGVTTVMQRPANPVSVKRMEIDPYKGVAFWMADGVIESCTLSGKYFQPNMSAPGVSVRSITLDLQERRVYYVGTLNQSTSLFSMDYIGGGHRTHFSLPQMRSVYGLSLLGGMLYWVNYADVKDVLYKAPVNLTSRDRVQVLTPIEKAVWHMKLVHQDIQKEPGEDPCRSISCSHICVSNATSAHCSCPKGMQLNLDEITCSGAPTVSNVTTTITPPTPKKTASGKTFNYHGCFEFGYFILMHLNHIMHNITLQKCVNYCEKLASTYAGISDNYCFCGLELGEISKRGDHLCNTPCPDDPHSTCGGEFLMSIYEIQGNSPFGKL